MPVEEVRRNTREREAQEQEPLRATLKESGERFLERTTRSSLWTVSDSVSFCLPFSIIRGSFSAWKSRSLRPGLAQGSS